MRAAGFPGAALAGAFRGARAGAAAFLGAAGFFGGAFFAGVRVGAALRAGAFRAGAFRAAAFPAGFLGARAAAFFAGDFRAAAFFGAAFFAAAFFAGCFRALDPFFAAAFFGGAVPAPFFAAPFAPAFLRLEPDFPVVLPVDFFTLRFCDDLPAVPVLFLPPVPLPVRAAAFRPVDVRVPFFVPRPDAFAAPALPFPVAGFGPFFAADFGAERREA